MVPTLVGAGLSAAQGMFGSKQKQNQTSTSSTDKTYEQQQQQNSNQQRTFDENPLMAAAREALLPIIGSEFNKAQKPIYGQAQQASFMESLNELAQSAMQRMTQGVAGSGGLRSGRFAGGTADIEKQRFGDANKFFANLPFQEEQARSGRVNNLLGLATNWLGSGPINETITGNASSTASGKESSTTIGNQTTTGGQGGGLSGMASNLIGFGGGVLGDTMSGNGAKWGFGTKNNSPLTPDGRPRGGIG